MPTGNIIKIGDKFTRLTVLAPAGHDRDGKTLWLCACKCFNLTWARTAQLNSRMKKSCGCLRRDVGKRNRTHGMTVRQRNAPEWNAWSQMRYRCSEANHQAYARYGGRGIKVCSRFDRNFMAFYRCVGVRPSEQHSIDRIDNNGHYSCGTCAECRKNGWPMNVRWATKKEQSQNRSMTVWLTHDNQTLCLAEWARRLGINEQTIRSRLQRGYSTAKALTAPVAEHWTYIIHNGETHSIAAWSRITGIHQTTLHTRLKAGWSIDKTLSCTPRGKRSQPPISSQD